MSNKYGFKIASLIAWTVGALAMVGAASAQQVETGAVALGSDFAATQTRLAQDGFSLHQFKFSDSNMELVAAIKLDEKGDYSETYGIDAINGRIFFITHHLMFPKDKPVLYRTLRSQLAQKYGTPASVGNSPQDVGFAWIFDKPAAVPTTEAVGVCNDIMLQLQGTSESAPGPNGTPENFSVGWPRRADIKCPKVIFTHTIGFTEPGKGMLSTDLAGGIDLRLFDGQAYFAYLKQKAEASAAISRQHLDHAGGNKANGL